MFLSYSLPYRNNIKYTTISKIIDPETLKLFITITINLLKEFEFQLKSNFDKLCYNQLNILGAKRYCKNISDSEIKKLKLSEKTK
ncbi:MAG: hypothetical protein GYA61_08355 [Spirochaetales bacterium]|nr:hypothetical protein [Spirochaetales bacterium]